MVAMQTWAQGTVAALDRQNGPAANGITTPAQTLASLQQELAQTRHLLDLARERIRELEAGLSDTPPEELVTLSRAAEIMAVHPSTITRWVAAGHFELRSIGGRKHPMIVRSSLHRPKRKKRSRKS